MSDVIECAEVNTARWHAVVFYRSETGLVDVHHALEELEELQSLVERGPNWDCIERIEITRGVPPEELMTIEQAQREGMTTGGHGMTDPRIEAAARALCKQQDTDPEGNDLTAECGGEVNWQAFVGDARVALAAADAVDQNTLRKALQAALTLLVEQEWRDHRMSDQFMALVSIGADCSNAEALQIVDDILIRGQKQSLWERKWPIEIMLAAASICLCEHDEKCVNGVLSEMNQDTQP